MARKKKYEKTNLSEEFLETIRITPEHTAFALNKLKYTINERPVGVSNPPKMLWCYLCNDFRKFGKSKKSKDDFDYMRCEICNISTEDFYIKSMNDLWGMK